MVIRAPDVDHAIKASLIFADVICNIGSEIGVLTVFSPDNTVFLIAKLCRSEPRCPVLNIEMSTLIQSLDCTLDQSRIEQRLFRKPGIEGHSKFKQVTSAVRKLLCQHEFMQA